MQLSTEVNTSHHIIFHDGTHKEITEKQANFLMEQSCNNTLKGCLVDGSFINFSSIAKILDAKDFWDQYPEKRPPDTYSQFDDVYGREGSQQIRKPSPNARKLMKEGFIQYHLGQGRTIKEAELKFEALFKK